MDKVYIQVRELLADYGMPLDFIVANIKAGKIKIYSMVNYDYQLENIDSLVNNYIAGQRDFINKTLTKKHRECDILNTRYPCICGLYDYEIYIEINKIEKLLKRKKDYIQYLETYKNSLENIENIKNIKIEIVKNLYLKKCEIENLIFKQEKSKEKNKKPGRPINTNHITETQKACKRVEFLYREELLLANITFKKIKHWVTQEMIGQKMENENPHTDTLNKWFTKFSKGKGRPKKNIV